MGNRTRKRVIIMGAAGRDFHNFNVCFRDREEYEVVAFTATQIPNIEGRRYPPELTGRLYPQGIPIHPESDLAELIARQRVDTIVFAYSDVRHEYVMHRASIANACGADFVMLSGKHTMLESKVPIVAVCAVRTGCGKSQTTRRVAKVLKSRGKKVVAVRHPMPYGDLAKQAVQRFATVYDLEAHRCTIEEREEYEPHIKAGIIVYAGVDYEKILREAEKEADVIVWDGGNNDLPFYKPKVHIVVADPHRAGHELLYHPGETNLRMADIIIVNKVDSAKHADIETVRRNAKDTNPDAVIIEAASPIVIDNPSLVTGKRVLIVEDGPTVTHGEMPYGAGLIAAERYGAREIADPRRHAVGSIKETFEKYPHVKRVLPAIGYSWQQIKDLEQTINATVCDAVVSGTPISLARIVKANKPILNVTYELEERTKPDLEDVLKGV